MEHAKVVFAGLFAACLVMLGGSMPSALADPWFPHPSGATWKYVWTDSTYNPSGTTEAVTVQSQNDPSGCGWQLAWTGTNPTGWPDSGTMCFQDESIGLVNTNWNSTPPPPNMPVLCVNPSACPDSLSSTLYNLIWGNRFPVLSEPLLQGTAWNATGGGANNVSGLNQYLGLQAVKVPAFPNGVLAAVVRTTIALGGTPGDDYGSGIRTTWWAYGVGAVRIVFNHDDGSVTNINLVSTNQRPQASPPDEDYFPLKLGLKGTYRWINQRHLHAPEIENVSVAAVANRSARILVKSMSGPIRTIGQYGFALRLNGLRSLWVSTSAATLAKLPRLGHGRHFFTPIDLMIFGFNPVLPAYGTVGSAWSSGGARDFQTYGVTGRSAVIGVSTVHVPAGTFRALMVRSWLTQPGYRFGSGVRTMWFAPGRGLVKLVFKHGDGSTSLVQLVR